jgi:hypothetical protein
LSGKKEGLTDSSFSIGMTNIKWNFPSFVGLTKSLSEEKTPRLDRHVDLWQEPAQATLEQTVVWKKGSLTDSCSFVPIKPGSSLRSGLALSFRKADRLGLLDLP